LKNFHNGIHFTTVFFSQQYSFCNGIFFQRYPFPTSQLSINMPHLTRDERRDCPLLRSIGWGYKQIHEKTGFSQHQIQYACTSPATPTKRSGRPPALTQAQIKDLIGYVCMSVRNRRLSFQQLANELDLGVGKKAIRAALIKEGFYWRLAMRKPPISERN